MKPERDIQAIRTVRAADFQALIGISVTSGL
jgi:hypothetical protein